VTYRDHTVPEHFHDFDGEYALTGASVKTVGKDVHGVMHGGFGRLFKA